MNALERMLKEEVDGCTRGFDRQLSVGWLPDVEFPGGFGFEQPLVYSWRVAFVRWLRGRF